VTRLPDHGPDDRVPLEEVEISVEAGWNLNLDSCLDKNAKS